MNTRRRRSGIIIIITDGEGDDLDDVSAAELAREMRDDGIRVYIIHVEHENLSDIMELIAHFTGGHAYSALRPESLARVLQGINERHEPLGPIPMDYYYIDRSWPFAGRGTVAQRAVHGFALRLEVYAVVTVIVACTAAALTCVAEVRAPEAVPADCRACLRTIGQSPAMGPVFAPRSASWQ